MKKILTFALLLGITGCDEAHVLNPRKKTLVLVQVKAIEHDGTVTASRVYRLR